MTDNCATCVTYATYNVCYFSFNRNTMTFVTRLFVNNNSSYQITGLLFQIACFYEIPLCKICPHTFWLNKWVSCKVWNKLGRTPITWITNNKLQIKMVRRWVWLCTGCLDGILWRFCGIWCEYVVGFIIYHICLVILIAFGWFNF